MQQHVGLPFIAPGSSVSHVLPVSVWVSTSFSGEPWFSTDQDKAFSQDE